MPLDDFDRALLDAIQRDASVAQRELGARVNLSSAAVNRRLKKLAEDGITRQTVTPVDPARVGYPLTIIVEVEVERIGVLSTPVVRR